MNEDPIYVRWFPLSMKFLSVNWRIRSNKDLGLSCLWVRVSSMSEELDYEWESWPWMRILTQRGKIFFTASHESRKSALLGNVIWHTLKHRLFPKVTFSHQCVSPTFSASTVGFDLQIFIWIKLFTSPQNTKMILSHWGCHVHRWPNPHLLSRFQDLKTSDSKELHMFIIYSSMIGIVLTSGIKNRFGLKTFCVSYKIDIIERSWIPADPRFKRKVKNRNVKCYTRWEKMEQNR